MIGYRAGFSLATSANNTIIGMEAGDVVSVADNEINLQDAVAIGAQWGSTSATAEDVNKDGVVNIRDLVHVGRNFGVVSGACS